MKVKPKECKSINAKTKGHGCGEVTYNRTYGLCNSCYVNWLLHTEKGQEHLERSKLQGQKRARKEKELQEKAEIRRMKIESTNWKSKLQTKVNELARLIDIGQPCIATGKHAKIHAGHVYTVQGHDTMRFNLHNIHRQSEASNMSLKDDLKLFEGISNEYGCDYADFITNLKSIRKLGYMKHEYHAFYETACELVKLVRNEGKTYNTPIERIKKRNYLNIKLGIYRLKHSVYETHK